MFSYFFFFFFKQKTAYEMRISDWSSDVCSSDLACGRGDRGAGTAGGRAHGRGHAGGAGGDQPWLLCLSAVRLQSVHAAGPTGRNGRGADRKSTCLNSSY